MTASAQISTQPANRMVHAGSPRLSFHTPEATDARTASAATPAVRRACALTAARTAAAPYRPLIWCPRRTSAATSAPSNSTPTGHHAASAVLGDRSAAATLLGS